MADVESQEIGAEMSLCRDSDGDVNIELYVSRGNSVNISVGPNGRLNWAGAVGGDSSHGNDGRGLAILLFNLLKPHAGEVDE